MPKVLINGVPTDVTLDQIFQDDGQTPFAVPTTSTPLGRVFTEEDVARIRQEEKDKLYGQIQKNNEELAGLREQVGSLTAAEQRRQKQLEDEQAALEAERRRQEEQGLDPATLIEKKTSEWQQQLSQVNQTWEQRFEQERQQREAAEALAAKEREMSDLRAYIMAQVDAHKDEIAPELVPWISGNTQAEVDAAIARAKETTDRIAAQFQELAGQQQVQPGVQVLQQQPPALPGTRVTTGPTSMDPAGQTMQLTAEQIAQMPMDEYVKLRGRLGIGGQSNNRGMFG